MTDELTKTVLMKILIVKDLKSKSIFAHVVVRKGTDSDGYVVQRLVDDVNQVAGGHR